MVVEKSIRLAEEILQESKRLETKKDKGLQEKLARMMQDPKGKAFTIRMTDEVFRSKRYSRSANQLCELLKEYGPPAYLPAITRTSLHLFSFFALLLPFLFVPLAKWMIRRQTAQVILPGEPKALKKHLRKRQKEGIRINLNHLGEAILGEAEAKRRLDLYLEDLKQQEIDYISIKISTLYSQINLVAFEETLAVLEERLSILYRAAGKKFVNLDMEEFRDLDLTVALFKRVLEKEEFRNTSAGIVLQSYLPNSFLIQKELTEWAHKRAGAPIKIRIVKGANLAMEQVEASLHGWKQAPYTEKVDTDANYKRMVRYALKKENAEKVHVGIASHNILDIAFALVLSEENQVQPFVTFEMLEGMAEPVRKAVQKRVGHMLLYCPAAKKEEFQNAVAYLMRRLDENTGEENFLRHSFGMQVGSKEWQQQVEIFKEAYRRIDSVPSERRRGADPQAPNEPEMDFALLERRNWVQELFATLPHIPFMPLGTLEQAEKVLQRAVEAKVEPIDLRAIADQLRKAKKALMAAMVVEGKKTIPEADAEMCEAIDFAEYYDRSREELFSLEGISWQPKGVGLVLPPWNFPLSIPVGGIVAALATGNKVIFKPSSLTKYIGQLIAEQFWLAGVPKERLQFFPCDSETVGKFLVKDPRVNFVIFTGSTQTARHFLSLRPSLDLMAETGGKNAFIITDMADRDLAIKDLLHSAFSHAGQKCSAASLAILEAPVYDDPSFLRQLKEAAESLKVGPAVDPSTKISPLIRLPNATLAKGLTLLEDQESWLLEPKQDPRDPCLWSPGIKMGVTKNSFTYKHELFGPVLALMRAKDLDHALELANGTQYGLTSGLHSLDRREHRKWLDRIKAGNHYINRTITGAIVYRQPFGGCKASQFGPGAKAGGPNYLTQFMIPYETTGCDRMPPTHSCPLVGQENLFGYRPRENMFFLIQEGVTEEETKKVLQAATRCKTPLHLYTDEASLLAHAKAAPFPSIRLLRKPSPALLESGLLLLVGPALKTPRLEDLHYLQEVSLSWDFHRYGHIEI